MTEVDAKRVSGVSRHGILPMALCSVLLGLLASLTTAIFGSSPALIATSYVFVGSSAFALLCGLVWLRPVAQTRLAVGAGRQLAREHTVAPAAHWEQIHDGSSASTHQRPRAMMAGQKSYFEKLGVCKDIITHGYNADICGSLDAALLSIEEHSTRWSLLVIAIDCVSVERSREANLGDVAVFRQICPDIPIILLSAESISEDAPEVQMESFCDLSVALPLRAQSFKGYIDVARQNNLVRRAVAS